MFIACFFFFAAKKRPQNDSKWGSILERESYEAVLESDVYSLFLAFSSLFTVFYSLFTCVCSFLRLFFMVCTVLLQFLLCFAMFFRRHFRILDLSRWENIQLLTRNPAFRQNIAKHTKNCKKNTKKRQK